MAGVDLDRVARLGADLQDRTFHDQNQRPHEDLRTNPEITMNSGSRKGNDDA
jgi:hypothetical protein